MRSIVISPEFEGIPEKTPIQRSVYKIHKLLYNVNRRKKGEKMNIGERLKSVRLQAGLSLRDFAEKVGVSAQAVSKYERGMDTPSSPVLIRLAKALSVRVEYLLRPINITLSQPQYRRRAALSKNNENEIQARVQDWLERYSYPNPNPGSQHYPVCRYHHHTHNHQHNVQPVGLLISNKHLRHG